MQTLDLSGERKERDGRFKSLFWPTVENAWDVDYLGQQGFWICVVIAFLSSVLLVIIALAAPTLAARVAVLIMTGAIFFVFVVGGMGVRESSWPAAAAIFVLYVVNQLGSGRPPGIVPIIIGAVLLSNLRATFLASRWNAPAEGEDRPTRFNETFRDKLVDQLPPRLWPVLRIPFFVIATLLFLFLCYVGATKLLRPHSAQPNDKTGGPFAMVTVDSPGQVARTSSDPSCCFVFRVVPCSSPSLR